MKIHNPAHNRQLVFLQFASFPTLVFTLLVDCCFYTSWLQPHQLKILQQQLLLPWHSNLYHTGKWESHKWVDKTNTSSCILKAEDAFLAMTVRREQSRSSYLPGSWMVDWLCICRAECSVVVILSTTQPANHTASETRNSHRMHQLRFQHAAPTNYQSSNYKQHAN